MMEFKLNPNNVMDYQEDTTSNKALHNSLQEHFVEKYGINPNVCWLEKYANWFSSLHIEYMTEQGLWNKTAVDPDNMDLFVEDLFYDPDEGYVEILDKLVKFKNDISKLPETVVVIGSFEGNVNVKKFLEANY